MSRVAEFFEAYRSAYARRALEVLLDCFAYPSHVTSDAGTVMLVPNTSKSEWALRLRQLFAMYDSLGVRTLELLELEERPLSPRLWSAFVHWRASDGDGAALYDFHTLYVLGEIDGALRITSAVSPDELPRAEEHRRRLGS